MQKEGAGSKGIWGFRAQTIDSRAIEMTGYMDVLWRIVSTDPLRAKY